MQSRLVEGPVGRPAQYVDGQGPQFPSELPDINIYNGKNGSRGFGHKLKVGAAVTGGSLALIGLGTVAFEISQFDPNLHVGLPATGDTPAKGHATENLDTVHESVITLQCDGQVTAAVGSVAVSHYNLLGVQVGGYYISKAFPIKEAECTSSGISTAEWLTPNANGTIGRVDIPTFTYSPAFESIDEFSPLICVHVDANASANQIKDALHNFDNKKACDPAGQTTGVGTNAHGAGNTEELARRDGVLAASITPVPKKIARNFEKDLIAKLTAEAKKQYPHAKIFVEQPQTLSDFEQTMRGWDSIKNEVTRDYTKIHFSRDGNQLKLDVSGTDASGTVYVPEKLTKKQVNALNNDASNLIQKNHQKSHRNTK